MHCLGLLALIKHVPYFPIQYPQHFDILPSVQPSSMPPLHPPTPGLTIVTI